MPARTMETLYEIFVSKVDTSGGPESCHLWRGAIMRGGYGKFSPSQNAYTSAHRWLLGYLRGKPLLPDEWALHHCDNPPCCNPLHLYIGDVRANHRDMRKRGRQVIPLAAVNAAKTHCKHGHEFTPENTYTWHGKTGRAHRCCRACNREAAARYRSATSDRSGS